MKRVLVVFGTRPEAIKLAPVIRELQKFPDRVKCSVCVTGQHREMLGPVLDLFNIVPDYNLDLMSEDQSLASLTGRMLPALTGILEAKKENLVVVEGDTTSAMIASLAAFYQQVPVGHVEAGLRTGDRYSPFPEEVNRRLISVLATLHFAPTQAAADTLISEGIPRKDVFLTGNPVVDALLMTVKETEGLGLPFALDGRRLILVTAHRRENFGQPLQNICEALKEIVERNGGVEIVYPVHLNPNVQRTVYPALSGVERVRLVPPVNYAQFARLLASSYLVITDSGGIQEEAPILGKPVLVVRTETERPEAVESGVARVVGTEKEAIISNVELLLNDEDEYRNRSRIVSPFGDGQASARIARHIVDFLKDG